MASSSSCGWRPAAGAGFDPHRRRRVYAVAMSKPEHISVSILSAHNGLQTVLLFAGAGQRRHLVLRTHWTYDPEEGTPSYRAILARSMEALDRALDAR